MQEDAGHVISQFLAELEFRSVTLTVFKRFLIALPALPLDLPLLQGCGKFLSGEQNNFVARNIDSRYRRIAFVQKTLEKINVSKAKTDKRFEDIVFDQSDFSIYQKIDAETFSLLYLDGLDDLSDDFYTKTFSRDKSEIRKIISARYKLVNGFYLSDGNPLLIPIMQSIHSSLDFVLFPNQDSYYAELETLFDYLHQQAGLPEIFFQYLAQEEDDLFLMLLQLFDKTEVPHDDGTMSRFFLAEEKGMASLFAVFNPEGKPFTKLMTVSKVPYGNNINPGQNKNHHAN
jgi:hypothetical protein